MAITQGTWGNLLGPLSNFDFGLTERLGFGGNNPNRAPVIGPESNPSLVGQKVTTNPDGSFSLVKPTAVTNVTPKTTVGTVQIPTSGNPQSSTPSVQQGPSEADLQNQMMNEINNMYGQSESILNEQGENLGQQAELAKQGVNLQKSQAEGSYKSAYEEAQKLAQGQQSTLDLSQRGAQSDAIRNLNALKQNASSKYGQGNSVFGAISEIIGQEFLRNQGNIQTAYTSSLDKINAFTAQAFQVFQNATTKLNEDVGMKLQQIDQSFRDGLLQVAMAKGQSEMAKSQARISLMQDALSNARNVANFRLENELALNTWKEQQQQTSNDAINYAKQLAQQSEQNTFAGQQDIQNIQKSSFLNNDSSKGTTAYNYRPQAKNEDEFSQFTNPWT